MVEPLPHQPKIEGSSLDISAGTRKEKIVKEMKKFGKGIETRSSNRMVYMLGNELNKVRRAVGS